MRARASCTLAYGVCTRSSNLQSALTCNLVLRLPISDGKEVGRVPTRRPRRKRHRPTPQRKRRRSGDVSGQAPGAVRMLTGSCLHGHGREDECGNRGREVGWRQELVDMAPKSARPSRPAHNVVRLEA